jgi:hypothetical protein
MNRVITNTASAEADPTADRAGGGGPVFDLDAVSVESPFRAIQRGPHWSNFAGEDRCVLTVRCEAARAAGPAHARGKMGNESRCRRACRRGRGCERSAQRVPRKTASFPAIRGPLTEHKKHYRTLDRGRNWRPLGRSKKAESPAVGARPAQWIRADRRSPSTYAGGCNRPLAVSAGPSLCATELSLCATELPTGPFPGTHPCGGTSRSDPPTTGRSAGRPVPAAT